MATASAASTAAALLVVLVICVLQLRVAREPEADQVARAIGHPPPMMQIFEATGEAEQPPATRLHHEVAILVEPRKVAAVERRHRCVLVDTICHAAAAAAGALGVEVEECRVVVRGAVGLVDMRAVVRVPRRHVHPVRWHQMVRPDPSEERAGGVQPLRPKVRLKRGSHTRAHRLEEGVAGGAHVLERGARLRRERRLRSLVEQPAHRPLQRRDHVALLRPAEEAVAEHACAACARHGAARGRHRRRALWYGRWADAVQPLIARDLPPAARARRQRGSRRDHRLRLAAARPDARAGELELRVLCKHLVLDGLVPRG